MTDSTRGCAFVPCGKPVHHRGLCAAHYGQQYRGETLRPARRRGHVFTRDGMGRKQCTACDEWKSETDFASDATHRDGLRSSCRRCHVSSRKERMYGLNDAGLATLLASQGGGCAGCGATQPGGKHGQWAIDHDHACCPYATRSCGRCVRGLLCNHCNLILGHAKDNPAVLRALADYLEAH